MLLLTATDLFCFEICFAREVIVTVMEMGAECAEDATRVQSQAVTNLVSAGITKSTSINLAPDWALITGQCIHHFKFDLPTAHKCIAHNTLYFWPHE